MNFNQLKANALEQLRLFAAEYDRLQLSTFNGIFGFRCFSNFPDATSEQVISSPSQRVTRLCCAFADSLERTTKSLTSLRPIDIEDG